MNPVVQNYLSLFKIKHPEVFFSENEIAYIADCLNPLKEISYGLDEWGNPDEKNMQGCDRPFLDEFVIERLKSKGITPSSIWPDQKRFAICLTHDVDRVESYSPRVFRRNILKRLKFADKQDILRLRLQYLKNIIKSFFYINRQDPLWKYDKWIALEREYEVNSTYFFFVRAKSRWIQLFDCDYKLSDRFKLGGRTMKVSEYIQYLDRMGHDVGLHGSFLSATDQLVFETQKAMLDGLLKSPSVATRQHYLHYDPLITSSIHQKNGVRIDSTLGLNKSAGFRMGTAMPFLLSAEENKLWELPLIFMDSAILGHLQLSIDDAKIMLEELMQKVENIGGCLTVNFHPDYINNEAYFELYRYLLQLGKDRNAFFGKCSDIVNILNEINSFDDL